jgi:hypothetical protein
MIRRTLALTTLTAGFVLATPLAADAHIEPDVSAVPAGAPAAVAFNLEHGCDDSPTTKLELQVPASVTDAQPVAKDGWTGSVTDNVVTFTGGSQPAHEETTFSITFTAPAEGTELRFPIVQTCVAGEIAWLDASEDDEHPAPVVLVGPAGESPSTEAPHADDDDDGATTTVAVTTTASDASQSDDDSNAGLVVGGVIVVAVVVGGAGLLVARSRRSS